MIDNATRQILDGDHDAMSDKQLRGHYAKGCRHDSCRAARTAYDRLDEAGKQAAKNDPTIRTVPVAPQSTPAAPIRPIARAEPTVSSRGAARRLQALFHLGYDEEALAGHLDWTPGLVLQFVTDPPTHVRAGSHKKIASTFQICRPTPQLTLAKPGTDLYERAIAAMKLADSNEWAGPFDWDDIDTDPAPIGKRTPHNFDDIDWERSGKAEPTITVRPRDQHHTIDDVVEPTRPSSGEPAVTTSEAITEPRRDGVPREGSEPAASVDPHVAPLEAAPAVPVRLPTISAAELAYQADEPEADGEEALVAMPVFEGLVDEETEDLRGEVSLLTIALEVRGEIIADLHATNLRLQDAISGKELVAAAARLELLAARHEIQQLTALTFHLADQCPDTTAPKPSLWRTIATRIWGSR